MELATGLTSRQLQHRYPDLYKRSYSLPGTHFTQCNLHIGKTDNPGVCLPRQPQRSERRGSEAQQRVLSSFQNLCGITCSDSSPPGFCPIFILSGVNFGNILKKRTPKPPSRKKQRGNTPESDHTASGQHTAEAVSSKIRGEADILIIQKSLGLVIIEIKAVGDLVQSQENPDSALGEVLLKISKAYGVGRNAAGNASSSKTAELTDKELFASQIVQALQLTMPVTYLVAFPNVSRADMERVATRYPDFMKVCKKASLL